jgi:hypothetical protein
VVLTHFDLTKVRDRALTRVAQALLDVSIRGTVRQQCSAIHLPHRLAWSSVWWVASSVRSRVARPDGQVDDELSQVLKDVTAVEPTVRCEPVESAAEHSAILA